MRNNPQYRYDLIEENDDKYNATIEKSGQTSTFTLRDVLKYRLQQKKILDNKIENLKVKRALIENTETHNEYVKNFSEQELFTIATYHDFKKAEKTLIEEVAMFEGVIKEYDDEIADIREAIGLDETVEMKPEQVEANDEEDSYENV